MTASTRHDLHIEEGVIGILLKYPDRFYDCGVTERHFYQVKHKNVIRSYMEKGAGMASAVGAFGGGCDDELMEIADTCYSDAPLESYLAMLDSLASIRDAAIASQRLLDTLESVDHTEAPTAIMSAAGELANAVSSGSNTTSEGADAEDVLSEEGGEELDTHLEAFPVRRKELIGICARPGCGKTSMLHSIAEHAIATREGPFVIFTMEVTRKEWFQRTMRQIASKGIIQYFRDGSLNEAYKFFSGKVRERYLKAIGRLIVDDEAGLSAEQIRARCLKWRAKYGRLSGIGIDQLSNVKRDIKKYGSQANAIKHDTEEFKKLPRELDCPNFLLSQFNRDPSGDGGWYTERDVFGSDGLLQDCDQLWLLQNHPGSDIDQDIRRVQLRRAKWRNGHLGETDLDFDTPSSTFRKGF